MAILSPPSCSSAMAKMRLSAACNTSSTGRELS